MDCIFCKIIDGVIPSYKIYENESVLCFLDINPDSNGHTLIVPKKHIKDIYEIDNETISKINEASKIIVEKIDKTLKPSGYRLVQNNGIVQEVKHYHMHIIPIYSKKTNKISVEELYNKIK
jgi:histidine triad (HIT) family protein